MTTQSVPKLYYFDIRGLAEPIRLCFAQAGVKFDDVRIKYEDWPSYKAKMPFGQCPVLEEDGRQLSQSMAILRYVGRKHGLEADDEWDRAVGDELSTSWLDMYTRSANAWAEPDKEMKKQKFGQVVEEFIKPRLRYFDDHFAKSKSGFLVGDKVTWCDFFVYNMMTMIRDFLKVSITSFENLEKFVNTIDDLPKVKEWHKNNPASLFSVFPSPMD